MNLLIIINSSLKDVYCSTTLFNHDLIRFHRFVSRIYPDYEIDFIINLYLTFLINMEQMCE